jgi:hypothetical protein
MALSRRERMYAIGTGLAAVLFVGNLYVLEPYAQARRDVASELDVTSRKLSAARTLLKRAGQKERDWRDMQAGGLKTDQSSAEFLVLDAVGDWAREAGVALTSRTPQPESRNDRTQILRLRAAGKCTMASAARLLWRVETAPIPLKVDELTLTTNKPGVDDLTLNLLVSTIWVKPEDPAAAKPPGGTTAAPARRAPAGNEGI